MKRKARKITYTDDSGEMDGFDEASILSPQAQTAVGIPGPDQARVMRTVRRTPKPARINIRLTAETLDGLKARAQEAGMPYQTLAASVLHMVAAGRLRLSLLSNDSLTK